MSDEKGDAARDDSDDDAPLVGMDLEGGKYTVILRRSGRLEALRCHEKWRDLTGDKLVLALVHRCLELANRCAELDPDV